MTGGGVVGSGVDEVEGDISVGVVILIDTSCIHILCVCM